MTTEAETAETRGTIGTTGTVRRRPATWSRKTFLRLGLALPAPLLLAACGSPASTPTGGEARGARSPSNGVAARQAAPQTGAPAATAQPAGLGQPAGQAANQQAGAAQQLQPTPPCADDDATPRQTEGPYFQPNSPQRASLLEQGINGTRLLVTGRVLGTNCRPVARALLDFWQADDWGVYDNTGYRLRGHQFADSTGQYRLETIVPGLYPGRTRHIHVKVQAPNRPVLTTQLYFPDEARNRTDSIFHPDLLLAMQRPGDEYLASFDFVLDAA
ncbi:MAG: dioxygenase [Chloroflexi bacterium]|nr:dioxygenase [Chloroflexota bacterium]